MLLPAIMFLISAELPRELENMLQQRLDAFDTAVIEWTYDVNSSQTHYRSRYAGSAFALTDHGDSSGCIFPELAGHGAPFTYSPYIHFIDEAGDQWNYQEGHLLGSRFVQGAQPILQQVDLRSIAMLPSMASYMAHDHMNPAVYFRKSLADYEQFEVHREGSLVVVQAIAGQRRIVWRLNPEQAWQPVQIRGFVGAGAEERLVAQWDATYGRWDDRWICDRAVFVRVDRDYRVEIKVSYAELCRSEHPGTLSVLEATGMLAGTNITRHTSSGREQAIFDGESRDYTDPERQERIDAGTWPSITEFWSRARAYQAAGCPGKVPSIDLVTESEKTPRLWEPYTRQFIIDHQLTSAHSREAWEIWAKHEKAARDYLRETEADLKKARAELNDDPSTELNPDAKRQLARYDKLMEPVRHRFHNGLVRELEHLAARIRSQDDSAESPTAAP